MKNERAISQETRNVLSVRGFIVLKHEDTITVGIPDCSITRDKITLWVEDKIIFCASIKAFVTFSQLVTKKRMPQLINMYNLAKHGYAQYWLYQVVGDRTYIGWCDPKEVMEAKHNGSTIRVQDIQEVGEFRRLWDMSDLFTVGA
jgi:hypothetical protein